MHRHTVDRLARAAILALGLLAGLVGSAEPAGAKGPSAGVIEGPGLAAPVELRVPGTGTIGPLLSTMVMESGFFPAAFGGDGMSPHPPQGDHRREAAEPGRDIEALPELGRAANHGLEEDP